MPSVVPERAVIDEVGGGMRFVTNRTSRTMAAWVTADAPNAPLTDVRTDC